MHHPSPLPIVEALRSIGYVVQPETVFWSLAPIAGWYVDGDCVGETVEAAVMRITSLDGQRWLLTRQERQRQLEEEAWP